MNTRQELETRTLAHPFAPVFDAQSRALVLGSFPSVKSRANEFYYGHPQNRFWRLLAALFGEPPPMTVWEKTVFLHARHIALWDVVDTCTIQGSADSTLKPQKLNDIAALLHQSDIGSVFANGQTAGRLYQKHLEKATGVPIIILPSTSPANAAWTLERLMNDWKPLIDTIRRVMP